MNVEKINYCLHVKNIENENTVIDDIKDKYKDESIYNVYIYSKKILKTNILDSIIYDDGKTYVYLISLLDNVNKCTYEVANLFSNIHSGHDINHIYRVYKNVVKILNTYENVTKETYENTLLISLLHDCDDYKLFNTVNNENARTILNKLNINTNIIESINKIGFSKRLKNIKLNKLEEKIVSDADMLDALGVNGFIRSIQYNISKNKDIFNYDDYEENVTYETYKTNKSSVINHMFEKILKLKDYMLTDYGKKHAIILHNNLYNLLKGYFIENEYYYYLKVLEKYKEE